MIKAAFIILTIAMSGLGYAGISAAAARAIPDPHKLRKFKTTSLLLLMGWLIYVCIISLLGVLQTAALPPRIPLLLIAPLFLFMFWFVRSKRMSAVINALPAAWLVYAQCFRILVELLLHSLYKQGLLPRAVTYEGYNYEIVIAISALVVGYLGYTKKSLPKSALILWNCMGLTTLAIVVFVFLSHVYIPGIYTHPEPLSVNDFGAFPFTLLPGFLMPLAVCMHVLSLVKLTRKTRYQDTFIAA